MLIQTLTIINFAILWYFILISLGYTILLIVSIPDILTHFKEVHIRNIISLLQSHSLPAITVIIPAYNESKNILETIDSIIKSQYPNIFIIVVNAGSTDDTLRKLITTYHLEKVDSVINKKIETLEKLRGYYISRSYKNITVLDKKLKDRSDALNMGINACRTPLFITIDADTLVEPTAISTLIYQMISQSSIAAIGGSVYIINGCTFKNGKIIEEKMSSHPLYAFQTCDYLRSFLFSRSGWNRLGGALCYSGTFTLFQLQPAVEIGGFEVDNLAQDFEVIVHLHAYYRERGIPYKIRYTPAAAVWTDVPGTLKEYWQQRYNWQYYTLKSLMPYRRMLFNPRYGMVGFFSYPFYLFGETLGAVVEFMAYVSLILSWYLGILDTNIALLFFLVCWGFTIVLTLATSLLNVMTFKKYRRVRDGLWIFLYSVIEVFGFRQFSVLCRVTATISYFYHETMLGFLHKKNTYKDKK